MRLNGYTGIILPLEGWLYRQGKTDYQLLLPENSSEAERFAARELDSNSGELSRLTQAELEAQCSLSPIEMFVKFYQQVREEPLSDERRALVEKAIRTLEENRKEEML